MSTSKHIDSICIAALAIVLIITVLFTNAGSLGVQTVNAAVGYETRLFNTSIVHTIDIVMDDWDSFLNDCTNEEYINCAVVIDGEAYKNVAIRAKGNTSLSQVASYGNDRYSFKIEFDHYDSANTYYGLDKLCLNNIIQDNTYMKDYLTYQLMGSFGVDAPLCSYADITINGEDWGLYLAIEGVEESFLQHNYGNDYGNLYKPDSSNMGGGRGNGRDFDMEEFRNPDEETTANTAGAPESSEIRKPGKSGGYMPDKFDDNMSNNPGFQKPDKLGGNMPDNFDGNKPGGGKMSSNDVSLIYTDDDFENYSNIFENAKTDITNSDQKRLIASLKQLNENSNIDNIVDVDKVIRYFVVHNFVLNFDSYTGSMIHNYYLYEKDGQLSMIPWDYNLAFGGFMSESDATCLVNYPIDTPVSGGTIDTRPMLAWIFNNEEYAELYHQYFAEFISQNFDNDYFSDMITSLEEMVSPYVEKDPTKFCTYEEFKEGVATLKEFCLLRAQSISGQLDGTIPTTSDGRTQDHSSLIDASDITISAMGSMEKAMHNIKGWKN